jgi:hypothetical protein
MAEVLKVAPASQPEGNTKPQPETPAIPEKFKKADGTLDVDALTKSYAELEAKLGATSKPADPLSTKPGSIKLPDPPKGGAEVTGEELSEFAAEFAEKGELSEDAYAKLKRKGYSRELVDGFIEGQVAVAAQREAQVLEKVGGREQYAKVVEWAVANLTTEEREAYNRAVTGGDVAIATFAVQGLMARMTGSTDSPPARRVVGGGAPVDAYASMQEFAADCRKPEYRTSQKFRDQCAAKLARSKI